MDCLFSALNLASLRILQTRGTDVGYEQPTCARGGQHRALSPCTMYRTVRKIDIPAPRAHPDQTEPVFGQPVRRHKRNPWCSVLSAAKQAFVCATHNAPSLALWTA